MADLVKTNSFKIVGTLSNVDSRTGTNRNGHNFISVTATINSALDGKTNEFTVSFYSEEFKADNTHTPNQLYISYSKMNELKGKKIEVTGNLSENRYFSTRSDQMLSSQRLNGRFVRGVADVTPDEGTFEIGGFIVSSVVEKKNKKNEVYAYEIAFGQANYSNTGLFVFHLNVDPEDKDILRGVQGYQVGNTAIVRGDLRSLVETVTSEVDNAGGFGAPVTRTYTNTLRSYNIKTGSAVIKDETAYPATMIKTLIDAYKAHDTEIMSAAKEKTSAAPVASASVVDDRQPSIPASLI